MSGAQLMGWDATNEVWVRCVVTADGKLIINPTGFLENPPTEDQDKKAPTSEWAFDHDADPAAHHAKYTDVESRGAIGDLLSSEGRLLKRLHCDYNIVSNMSSIDIRNVGVNRHARLSPPSEDTNYCKITVDQPGVGYVDAEIRLFKTNVYRLVIDQDNFQAELDNYLENPPTEDITDKAPSSEWAYDHWKDATAHHAKYTDGEAVGSFYARKKVLDTGTYTDESVSNISYVDLDPTSDTIHIKGLADGTEGQIIFFVVRSSSYQTIIYYNSGDAAAGNKILTTTKADVTVPDYASFFMIYDGLYWICNFIT